MLKISKLFRIFPHLESERFYLRDITLDQIDDLFEIYCDEETMRYEGMIPLITTKQVVSYIEDIQRMYRNRSSIRWGIYEKETMHLIGFVSLYQIDRLLGIGCIGYCLNKRWWHCGVMSESLCTIIEYLKESVHFHGLYATIWPQNEASKKLIRRLGFHYGAVLNQSGYDARINERVDMELYILFLRHFQKNEIMTKLKNNKEKMENTFSDSDH